MVLRAGFKEKKPAHAMAASAASPAAIKEEAAQKDLRLEKHSKNRPKSLKTVSRCSSTSRMSRELSELKKLESLLDEKERILRRKMEILQQISDSDSESTVHSEHSNEEAKRIRSWIDHSASAAAAETAAESHAEPEFVTPSSSHCGNYSEPRHNNEQTTQKRNANVNETSDVKGNVFVFDKLADALQKSIRSACSQEKSKLPSFDGNANDWLHFKSSYDETTSKYNLSASDNLQRLRLALKGEAKNMVSALLHSCSSPDSVIEALQLRYGNPTRIIKSQIAEIRSSRVIGSDPSDLSVFSAKLSNCVASITALDYCDYLRDTELYEAAISKLNSQLRSKFLQYADANVTSGKCRLLCLTDFVKKEAELSQKFIPECTYPRQAVAAPAAQGHSASRKYSINVTGNVNCPFCNGEDHNVTKCSKFAELSVKDRYDWAKTNKKCFRCLIYSHPGKNCKISKYLHRLLRAPKENNNDDSVIENSNPILTTKQKLGSLLKVVPVTVHGPKSAVKTYALLDEGASISLIDSKLAEKVGAEGQSNTLNIHGIGSSHQQFSSKSVKVTLENSTGSTYDITIRTMPNLNLHSQFLCKEKLITYPHIKSMQHNIQWYEEGTPQMIIGQDYWHLIVTRQLYSGKVNEPVISDTLLGLVVHGCVDHTPSGSVLSHTVIAHVRTCNEDELHGLIKESFKLDSLGLEPKPRSNPEVDRSIELLEKNTKKIDSHTWETGLLWKRDDNTFPNSNDKALKRLYTLERSFKKNPDLGKSYSSQMNRLFDLNFAEPYDKQERSQVRGRGWVLSHFAALNPNKPGKVRIVVDCADKIEGRSLNDYLLTGPDLLQPLLGVLWRFRRAPIAVAADIKDMFLKIKIKKEDQEFQKFYWREMEDSSPPKLYVMTSMLFGAKCSPSSAIFVLNRNAQDFIEEHPEAVNAIQQNHYCDDYLDSYITEQKAIDMVATVIKIHSHGNFNICNWASNSEAILQSIPEEKRACGNIQLDCTDSLKERTLGMMWQPSTDTLSFNLSMKRVPSAVSSGQVKPTKRQMLAVLMSVFDPIGLLSHFTIRGRILLQEVWRSGINWDSYLQDSEYLKWKQWLSDLQVIRDCSIPRCYITRPDDAVIQLHTFCDASSKAYAAACYLRYQFEDEVQVTLVAAKARVTPLKPCSIPRLELQAAVLGSKLAKTVDIELQLSIKEKFYWTDSITTLAWIRSDPRNYKPFVGHRLAAIDELSSAAQWKWVPTSFNPADVATRDSTKLDVSLDCPWFSGPGFLKKRQEEWPVEKTKTAPVKEAICEEKHTVNVIKEKEYNLPDITRFSSWKRLINSTAYVFLYIEKLKNKSKKEGIRKLTLELLDTAEKEWIKKTQEEDFKREITCLKEKENLPHDSKILQLSPVLDDDGIMRLGGRIDRAPDVPQEMKRPIILSGSNAYTKLLIHHYHKLHNHSSTETVVNEMRQKYWVLKLRSTVRSVAHNCQHCKIQRAAAVQLPMGDLPLPRLQHHKRPFTFCGLDYFGPVEVSIGRRREKRWGALFTCLVTKAVHMEIAASLTADSVIMAIRRMSARRGCPTAIYSDNGTNFKGADVELKKAWSEVDKEAISSDMLNRRIEWHFIPATAAHMAGVWERLVQSIKKALRATLHERAPKEEVLSTFITEAEQSVNSRPLTFVSVDPRDPEALTPYHFLIGSSSVAPIPGKFDDKDLMLRKQWKVAQRLADMFWSRWIREYLPTLLDRRMKGTSDQDIKEGQLVIIVDSNSPRNVWPRGVVTKIFPGQDNKIRVVEVRTVGGVFRRPVNKVIFLPIAQDDVGSPDGDASADCLQVFLSRLHEAERRARDGVVVGNTTSYSPT